MKYRWIAQDKGGMITKYINEPYYDDIEFFSQSYKTVQDTFDMHIPNWLDSLIDRTTHDYKIEDGILIRVDKLQRHEYADVFIECALDKTKVLQFKTKGSAIWHDSIAAKDEGIEWRVKPQD